MGKYALKSEELVTELCRLLKEFVLCRLSHCAPRRLHHEAPPASKNAYNRGNIFLITPTFHGVCGDRFFTARPKASPDFGIKTCSWVRLLAGTVGEHSAKGSQGRFQCGAVGERADVVGRPLFRHAGLSFPRLMRYIYFRERFARDGNVEIVLIVPHENIVFRRIFFNMLGLGDKRFNVGCRFYDSKRACFGEKFFTASGFWRG